MTLKLLESAVADVPKTNVIDRGAVWEMLSQEAMQWLVENVGFRSKAWDWFTYDMITVPAGHVRLRFLDETHAVAFKLRWG